MMTTVRAVRLVRTNVCLLLSMLSTRHEARLRRRPRKTEPGSMTPMQRIVRRDFLKTSLLPAALPLFASQSVAVHAADEPATAATELPGIIDTNVHLFDWPFRSLKYRRTAD